MTTMTWPQFKHHHVGKTNEEISSLWKQFKAGEYVIEEDSIEASKETEEGPREEEEVEQLPERVDDASLEEPLVTEPEKTEEPIIKRPTPAPAPKKKDEEKRLRDLVLFDM